jgi:predicted RNase H-like HicB family nuclease
LGLKGAVVGEGDSYDSALADAKSAAAFHIESFGKEAFEDEDEVMEAFIAEASLVTG